MIILFSFWKQNSKKAILNVQWISQVNYQIRAAKSKQKKAFVKNFKYFGSVQIREQLIH